MILGAALMVTAAILSRGNGALVLDDARDIVEHPLMRDGLLAALAKSPFRFVTYLTYWINLNLPMSEALSLHFGNIVLHVCASITIFLAIRAFIAEDERKIAALVGALYFAMNPFMCSTVYYVSARPAILVTIGFCLTAWGMKKYIEQRKPAFAGAVIAGTLISIFSKESGVAVVGLIIVIVLLFGKNGSWKLAAIPAWAISLMYIILRMFHKVDLGDSGAGNIGTFPYLLTQLKVIPLYMVKILFPINLSLQWDIRASTGFLHIDVVPFLFLLIAIGIFLYIMCRANKAALFFLAWIPLALSVESSFIPLSDLAFDHRFYTAGVGVSALIGIALADLIAGRKGRKILYGTGVAAMILFSIMNYHRGANWRDNVGPWREAVLTAPDSFRARYNLGHNLYEDGRFIAAMTQLNSAIAIGGKTPGETAFAYNSKGLIDIKRRNYPAAITALESAVRLEPNYGDAVYHLGVAYMLNDEPEKALRYFNDAARYYPPGDVKLETVRRKAQLMIERKNENDGGVIPQ